MHTINLPTLDLTSNTQHITKSSCETLISNNSDIELQPSTQISNISNLIIPISNSIGFCANYDILINSCDNASTIHSSKTIKGDIICHKQSNKHVNCFPFATHINHNYSLTFQACYTPPSTAPRSVVGDKCIFNQIGDTVSILSNILSSSPLSFSANLPICTVEAMIIDVINLEDKVDICCKAEASISEKAEHFPILEHFNIDTYLNFILNLMKTDCDFRSYHIIKLMHEDFLEDIFMLVKNFMKICKL